MNYEILQRGNSQIHIQKNADGSLGGRLSKKEAVGIKAWLDFHMDQFEGPEVEEEEEQEEEEDDG